MASKQYISPIRLFQHCSVEISDGVINVSRIKKQLVAEFDFAKTGFIEIDGYTYNKTDVLEEIERPDFGDRLKYHQRIWECPTILSVIEKNTGNLNYLKTEFDKFQNDKAFDEFFSPYFAAPFNHLSRGMLNEGKLYEASTLLLFEDFLQPMEREEGFRSLRVFLEENVRLFRNISKENYGTFRTRVQPWRTSGWDDFLNNLPAELDHFRTDIAIDLINLTVKIQKTHKADCWTISQGLVRLRELPSHLRDTILNNDKVFNPKVSSGSNYGWIIWVAIILLRVIASGGCN
ncbi:hypothetical protein [Ferruginibacter sp.]